MNSRLPKIETLQKARALLLERRDETFSLSAGTPDPDHFPRVEFWPLLLSAICVGAVTAVLLLLDQALAVNLVPVAYLIPVIVAATQWGLWPSILASATAAGAADFFFIPPLYSFQISDPQDTVNILLFLVVALVSSNLASRLRRETERSRLREREIQQLYEFSRLLAACFTVSDLIAAIEKFLFRALGQQAAFFAARSDHHFELADSSLVPKVVQDTVASMVAGLGIGSCTIVDEATRNVWLLGAVGSESAIHGLVAVNIGLGSRAALANRTLRVATILDEVSLTLRRLDIDKAMEDARLRLQAQLLRDAFHGTLSHELCTPLATIRGSASVLASLPGLRDDSQIESLVEAISDQAAELDGFIRNLLNATRVTAGGVIPRVEWADPKDIINAAIARRTRRLAAHRLEVEFARDLPLVKVDSGLIEEACGQLLENAAKYSPTGSTITVNVGRSGQGGIKVSISDQGVGITPDERQQLGRRSYRGRRHQSTIPGSGLGFWIASTFVRANNGSIDITSRGTGQGTTAWITLPAAVTHSFQSMALSDE